MRASPKGQGESGPTTAGATPARSFRLVCDPSQAPLVEELLRAQGFSFEPEPFWPLARRLTGGSRPLGDSLAARFGLIYIQDRSSMLPPLLLAPKPGATVLDTCASPGSKTGLLAQLVGLDGFVLGNEPSRDRLETLRANMRRLCLARVATCSCPAERLDLTDGAWDNILLDPPCSGWGTADKNPQVLRLWAEDKTGPLVALQRRLLERAAALLAPGGRLVYSTCTTHVRENEEQVTWALDNLPLRLLPAAEPAGFSLETAGVTGTLRVDGERSGAQGFYLALFEKSENSEKSEASERTGGAGRGASGQGGRSGRQSGRQTGHLPGKEVRPEDLARSALPVQLDLGRLGPGRFYDFGGRIHFLPEQALDLLPAGVRWQGMLLGRLSGSAFRPEPGMRLLVPQIDGSIDVDDVQILEGLLAGRSIDHASGAKLVGLSYQGLPLGFLKVRAGRAFRSGG